MRTQGFHKEWNSYKKSIRHVTLSSRGCASKTPHRKLYSEVWKTANGESNLRMTNQWLTKLTFRQKPLNLGLRTSN